MPLKRLKQLEGLINDYKKSTAEGTEPNITPKEYESYLNELDNLLELVYSTYVSTPVQNPKVTGDDVVEIKEPMLSNTKFVDVTKFLQYKTSIEASIFEVKYDGVLARLVYSKKGVLEAIHLKGDGERAINLISKKSLIKNIPEKISSYGGKETYITGALVCLKNEFEEYCEKNNLENKTPKNVISNILGKSISKKNNLKLYFIAHHASKNVRTKCKTYDKLLGKLSSDKFAIPEYSIDFPTDLPESIYPVDGVIIKSNDLKYWDLAGPGNGYYPFSGCYKYPLDIIVTQVKQVVWGVNHSGALKGILLTSDIRFEDKVYNLCHFNYPSLYMKNGIAIGSNIVVINTQDRLPRIIGISEKGMGVALKPPIGCPYCSTPLTKIIKGDFACENEECQGRLEWRLKRTISFRGLDITSLKASSLKLIIKENKLRAISDIFKISKHGIRGTNLSKGTLSKISSEINKAKDNVSLANWIFACGIYGLNESRCHTLEKEIRSLKSIVTPNLILDFLTSLKSMNELFGAAAIKIVSYAINDYDNIKEFLGMYNYKKVNMESYTEKPLLSVIGNLNFRKEDLVLKLRKLGYCMDSTITKDTKYVFVTDKKSPGKIALAKRFNIRIVEAHDMTVNDIIKYLEIRN